ncbi:MAG TPA: VOC family protein [Kofleriaceae bacterium]
MNARDIDEHQLHGIQPVVQVADVAAAIAYYRDTLGFEVDFVSGEPPMHARVSSGDRDGPTAVRIRLVPFEGGGARADRGYFWIHVGRDLDGLFAKYRAAGVEIVSEPKRQPWGLRDFRVRDSNGHLYCFAAED